MCVDSSNSNKRYEKFHKKWSFVMCHGSCVFCHLSPVTNQISPDNHSYHLQLYLYLGSLQQKQIRIYYSEAPHIAMLQQPSLAVQALLSCFVHNVSLAMCVYVYSPVILRASLYKFCCILSLYIQFTKRLCSLTSPPIQDNVKLITKSSRLFISRPFLSSFLSGHKTQWF